MPVGSQFGYVQFLGTHRKHGEAILVSPELYKRQAAFAASFFSRGYVTFYAACLGVTQKRIEVVAQSTPQSLPKRFRRPSVVLPDGSVESWVIEGGWREVVKKALTDEERQIPIAKVWNHEMLCARIASGWTPATDGQEIVTGSVAVAR